MKTYIELLKTILNNGNIKKDRTGTGTISLFGYQMRFNLNKGFPLLTTKKCNIHSIIHELLWFLKGDTNINYLKKNKVFIWDEWADKKGNLGPIYGKQWRKWKNYDGSYIDQISKILKILKKNPSSRRMLVSSWNVSDLDKMSLMPCHVLFQLYVFSGKISCQLYQRSCDAFLGLPFNIASYAFLTHMLAHQSNLKVHELILSLGDVHLYKNHVKQAKIQIIRKPRLLPKLIIKNKPFSLFHYHFDDFKIVGYNPYPHIKAPISI